MFLTFEFLLNGGAFFIARYDKKVAQIRGGDLRKRARDGHAPAARIPEKTLLLLAALGAGPGLALAFSMFRHKTRKARFLVPFWAAFLVGIAISAAWLWGLGCFDL